MKTIIIISLVLFIYSITFISAMDISFYYSETCPHCQTIYPVVFQQANKYPSHIFNFYEVSNKDNHERFLGYGFTGVPAFVINTDDKRKIKFVGANEPKLKCELQEMTTKDCPTNSADTCTKESWFKK